MFEKYLNMSGKFVAVTIAVLLLGSTPARAQQQDGFYIGGSAGAVFAGNTRADGIFTSTGTILDGQRLGPEPGKTARGKFDPSLTTSVALGYDFGQRRYGRFRIEGELFYQKADTDKYEGILNGSDLNPAGRVDTSMSGLALNGYYHFGEYSGLSPYVYIGFGRANSDTKYDFQGQGKASIDGSSELYQGGFGAEYSYNDRTTFDLKYRFRRAGLNERGLDTDIDAQGLEFGIRFAF